MSAIQINPRKLMGTLQVPPSKSMAHRAIICASLAQGQSKITNIVMSKDIEATINAMKALGALIKQEGSTLIIDGSLTLGLSRAEIDCEESGSTLRFMIPVSLVNPNRVHFTGKGKLGQRPLDIYYSIFDEQKIIYLYKKDILDLYINGQMHAGEFSTPGNVSSQFISGLLFALPLMEGDSKIHITTPLESKGYIDLTLQMLETFGIEIENNNYEVFTIKGMQTYRPHDYQVEADFSQAAFFLVADVLGSKVVLEGLNLSSAQGDKEVISYLEQMGAKLIAQDQGYLMEATQLQGITIDASQCPDIIPVLAVACAMAKGTSHIINAKRLRIKECDRLKATVEVLKAAGIEAIEKEEEMIITGSDHFEGADLQSYNDHRMAMMEAIMATRASGKIQIDSKECVKKSYPNFFEDYALLKGDYHEC